MVRLIAAGLVTLLVAAACGGDSDTDQTAAPVGGAQLAASPGVERSEPVAGRRGAHHRAGRPDWRDVAVQPDQEWVDLLTAEHGVTVEPLDLREDPEGSRDVINQWVADRTEDLIAELLPEGFIGTETVLVLTDAVYLAAQWQTTFGKYGPVQGEFTRLDGSTVPVQYMQELELADRRGVGDGWSAAELPYVGGDLSMLVIVPDEGHFEDMRRQQDQAVVDQIDAALTTGPYELLPRWETNSQIDLLPWLEELGASPGLYPAITPTAFLDAAVHGADISVDEWGTVAAAATGLGSAGQVTDPTA